MVKRALNFDPEHDFRDNGRFYDSDDSFPSVATTMSNSSAEFSGSLRWSDASNDSRSSSGLNEKGKTTNTVACNKENRDDSRKIPEIKRQFFYTYSDPIRLDAKKSEHIQEVPSSSSVKNKSAPPCLGVLVNDDVTMKSVVGSVKRKRSSVSDVLTRRASLRQSNATKKLKF